MIAAGAHRSAVTGRRVVPAVPGLQVILVPMLGQSNMQGRNAPSDGTDAGASNVYEYDNYAPSTHYHTIQPVGSVLHFLDDGTGTDIDGPGITALNLIAAANPTAKIVSVGCGYGSSALAIGGTGWNSSPTPGAGGSLFESAVTNVQAAGAAALVMWPGASVTIHTLFVQGEQDISNANTASMTAAATYTAYYAGISAFVPDWRSRVTIGTHGKFIIGSVVPPSWIVGHAGATYSATAAAVNKAHVYASLNISNVLYAPGPDMAPGTHDGLHYQPAAKARTQGANMGNAFTDTTGPSVTTGTTQGGNVGTTTPILLTHDDPLGHATFHFAGGANDALFSITDAYVNSTTQPQVIPVDNTMAAGTYVFKVKARDGSGNYGADRTITFTQAVPSVVFAMGYGVSVATGGDRFGTSGGRDYTVDIKAGANFITFGYASDSNQGSYSSCTVNGNTARRVGYASGANATYVTFVYDSAVDITGATVNWAWGAITMPWGLMTHTWATGVDSSTAVVDNSGNWGSGSNTSASVTLATGEVTLGHFHAATGNTFSGSSPAGSTYLGKTNEEGVGNDAAAYRETTGSVAVSGGGGYSANIAIKMTKTA